MTAARAALTGPLAVTLAAGCTPAENTPASTSTPTPQHAPTILTESTIDTATRDDARTLAVLAPDAAAIVIATSHPWLEQALTDLNATTSLALPDDATEGTDRIPSSTGPIAVILVNDTWHPDETAAALAGTLAAINRTTRNTTCEQAREQALAAFNQLHAPQLDHPLALPELSNCPTPVGAQSLRHQRWHNPALKR